MKSPLLCSKGTENNTQTKRDEREGIEASYHGPLGLTSNADGVHRRRRHTEKVEDGVGERARGRECERERRLSGEVSEQLPETLAER